MTDFLRRCRLHWTPLAAAIALAVLGALMAAVAWVAFEPTGEKLSTFQSVPIQDASPVNCPNSLTGLISLLSGYVRDPSSSPSGTTSVVPNMNEYSNFQYVRTLRPHPILSLAEFRSALNDAKTIQDPFQVTLLSNFSNVAAVRVQLSSDRLIIGFVFFVESSISYIPPLMNSTVVPDYVYHDILQIMLPGIPCGGNTLEYSVESGSVLLNSSCFASSLLVSTQQLRNNLVTLLTDEIPNINCESFYIQANIDTSLYIVLTLTAALGASVCCFALLWVWCLNWHLFIACCVREPGKCWLFPCLQKKADKIKEHAEESANLVEFFPYSKPTPPSNQSDSVESANDSFDRAAYFRRLASETARYYMGPPPEQKAKPKKEISNPSTETVEDLMQFQGLSSVQAKRRLFSTLHRDEFKVLSSHNPHKSLDKQVEDAEFKAKLLFDLALENKIKDLRIYPDQKRAIRRALVRLGVRGDSELRDLSALDIAQRDDHLLLSSISQLKSAAASDVDQQKTPVQRVLESCGVESWLDVDFLTVDDLVFEGGLNNASACSLLQILQKGRWENSQKSAGNAPKDPSPSGLHSQAVPHLMLFLLFGGLCAGLAIVGSHINDDHSNEYSRWYTATDLESKGACLKGDKSLVTLQHVHSTNLSSTPYDVYGSYAFIRFIKPYIFDSGPDLWTDLSNANVGFHRVVALGGYRCIVEVGLFSSATLSPSVQFEVYRSDSVECSVPSIAVNGTSGPLNQFYNDITQDLLNERICSDSYTLIDNILTIKSSCLSNGSQTFDVDGLRRIIYKLLLQQYPTLDCENIFNQTVFAVDFASYLKVISTIISTICAIFSLSFVAFLLNILKVKEKGEKIAEKLVPEIVGFFSSAWQEAVHYAVEGLFNAERVLHHRAKYLAAELHGGGIPLVARRALATVSGSKAQRLDVAQQNIGKPSTCRSCFCIYYTKLISFVRVRWNLLISTYLLTVLIFVFCVTANQTDEISKDFVSVFSTVPATTSPLSKQDCSSITFIDDIIFDGNTTVGSDPQDYTFFKPTGRVQVNSADDLRNQLQQARLVSNQSVSLGNGLAMVSIEIATPTFLIYSARFVSSPITYLPVNFSHPPHYFIHDAWKVVFPSIVCKPARYSAGDTIAFVDPACLSSPQFFSIQSLREHTLSFVLSSLGVINCEKKINRHWIQIQSYHYAYNLQQACFLFSVLAGFFGLSYLMHIFNCIHGNRYRQTGRCSCCLDAEDEIDLFCDFDTPYIFAYQFRRAVYESDKAILAQGKQTPTVELEAFLHSVFEHFPKTNDKLDDEQPLGPQPLGPQPLGPQPLGPQPKQNPDGRKPLHPGSKTEEELADDKSAFPMTNEVDILKDQSNKSQISLHTRGSPPTISSVDVSD